MRTLIQADSIESIREIWWDVRPHPGYGTVEIRVCDSIPDLDVIQDLAALIQALVVGLCNHYENGTQLPYLDSWIIHENKWRATRYGMDAKLILDSEGNQEDITTVIENTIIALEPEINKLDISDSMDRILSRIKKRHSYYGEQIKLFNKNKSFQDLIVYNVDKFKNSI